MPLLATNPKDRIILGLMTFGYAHLSSSTLPNPSPSHTSHPNKTKQKKRTNHTLPSHSPDPSSGARVVNFPDFTATLDYFQSQGYHEVDTARSYVGGKQEAWTGEAGWKERGLTLATKHYPFQPGEHKPEKITAALGKSLELLRSGSVDIFYLHAADRCKLVLISIFLLLCFAPNSPWLVTLRV